MNVNGKTGERSLARCAFAVAWLGRWPTWMPQFLESCEANPEFHWHIFTDIGPLPTPCSNVYVHKTTLDELRERASRLLQFSVNLQHTYKICELKPLFGELFSEVLGSYEFWGYTDLDIIYGKLSNFVTGDLLDACDVFTSAPRLIVGHFTLFRNITTLNSLYRTVPDLKEIMQAYDCVAFDEKAFAACLKHAATAGKLRLRHNDIQLDDCVCLDSGRKRFLVLRVANRLYDVSAFRELAYYHFIRSKYQSGFRVDVHRRGSALALNADGIRNLIGPGGVVTFIRLMIIACTTAIPWYLRRTAATVFPSALRARIRRLLM